MKIEHGKYYLVHGLEKDIKSVVVLCESGYDSPTLEFIGLPLRHNNDEGIRPVACDADGRFYGPGRRIVAEAIKEVDRDYKFNTEN